MTKAPLSILVPLVLCGPALGQQWDTETTPKSSRTSIPANLHWGDYDADGLADAFVITRAATGRLLANRGDGTLEDVTERVGLAGIVAARFALWEDIEGDGDLDLFVGTLDGPSRLFTNQGNATFVETTQEAGLVRRGEDVHAGFLDFDADGRRDLHVRTQLESLLYRNLGDGLFEPVELEAPASIYPPVATGAPATIPFAADDVAPDVPGASTGAKGKGDRSAGTFPVEREAGTPSSRRVVAVDPSRPTNVAPPIGGLPAGGSENATTWLSCALTIKNMSGTCMSADSRPTLGRLYPLTEKLFVDDATGYVGVGTTTPDENLQVAGRIHAGPNGGDGYAVKGEYDGKVFENLLARGYLGVKGAFRFDDVSRADWTGYEIGVAGISTALVPSSDEIGILGHGSGAGVRGENSKARTVDYAELGKPGVGIEASGSSLAGDFVGDVGVEGNVDVEGLLQLYDGPTARTVLLHPDNLGAGANFSLFNGAGTKTFDLKADRSNLGSPVMELSNAAGEQVIELDGGFGDDGGDMRLSNSDGDVTIELDGEASFGSGEVTLFDANGTKRVELDSGGVRLTDSAGTEKLKLNSPSGVIELFNYSGTKTLEINGDEFNLFGPSDYGSIYVSDGFGNNRISLVGDTDDAFGMGGEICVILPFGLDEKLFEATGVIPGVGVGIEGAMFLREFDGDLACAFTGNAYKLYDSSGTATITWNRQTGAKSAVVDLPSYGQRLLYCMESPEVWFEDFGSARLEDGMARVDLDPIFLESVTIDEANPMKVFVTLNADLDSGVYVEKGQAHFVVRERNGGSGDAAFDWRVVVKRKGLENKRLDPLDESASEARTAKEGEGSMTCGRRVTGARRSRRVERASSRSVRV